MIFILYFCLLAESESSSTDIKELDQLYNDLRYHTVMEKLTAFEQMLARLEESVSKIQVIFNTFYVLNRKGGQKLKMFRCRLCVRCKLTTILIWQVRDL